MKILFLTPRFPYPIIGGDRLKPYMLLSHLTKEHDVTLVSFYQGKKIPSEYYEHIKNLGIDVHIIPLNPVKSGLRSIPQTLLKQYPLEIAYYHHHAFNELVDDLIKKCNFDISFAFFMRTAEYLKNKKIKKILVAEDCRTLYQKRSYQESNNLIQKLVRWWEFKKLKEYEPKIVNFFDAVSLVTKNDIEAMSKQNPRANYMLLTNGTDILKFRPADEYIEKKGILFAGKLDIWANVLMLKNIVRDIFPKIKQAVPEAKLNIVGANPPKEVKELSKVESITLVPNVPEMVPYLQNAELFLHPHLGGTGIQNKLLEAMACGCPVVTTPTGIQGIPATHGIDVLIGKNNNELIEHSITILKNPAFARQISKNCRDLIVNNLSWEVVFRQLNNIINDVLNRI